MMRQYTHIKQQHAHSILFFRLGDFYEVFHGDAHDAAHILGLTLTQRNGIPMCGFPHYAAQRYIAQLLNAGRTVAICEQTVPAEKGQKLVQREVVQVITPGVAIEDDYLESERNNWLVALSCTNDRLCEVYLDLSTGDLRATSFAIEQCDVALRSELARLDPREIIVQESMLVDRPQLDRMLSDYERLHVNRVADWAFDCQESYRRLCDLLGVINLNAFGIDERQPDICPANALLDYVDSTAHSVLRHIRTIRLHRNRDFVALDEVAQSNLELVRNLRDGGARHTLLETLDYTLTAMGRRRLRRWLLTPLTDIHAILQRQQQVNRFYRDQMLLRDLREQLEQILDLERLNGRVAMRRATPRDMAGILQGIEHGLTIDHRIGGIISSEMVAELSDIVALLKRALLDRPAVRLEDGAVIRDGYNQDIDELRTLHRSSAAVLDEYLKAERTKSGIGSLKIRFNRILGYYFEMTKTQSAKAPDYFIRRQSTASTERYTTERLAELESQINGAAERIAQLERRLFQDICEQTAEHLDCIIELSESLSSIDCLQSLSWTATRWGYVQPELEESNNIDIELGRHPVVEANMPPGDFTPNSLRLDHDRRLALITGPNMAGKSTYLRQTALIVLMAQIGSFVPAQRACIGLVDAIFCRVGASDNLARGESTFLVEMSEVAYIVRNATPRSLIVMDEIGRGTATHDGAAIARAVIEYLLDTSNPCCLCATHFYDLTTIQRPGFFNLSLAVNDEGERIVFLKRVKEGPAHTSYGLHVARLAGVPDEIVRSAQHYLQSRRQYNTAPNKTGATNRDVEEQIQHVLFFDE